MRAYFAITEEMWPGVHVTVQAFEISEQRGEALPTGALREKADYQGDHPQSAGQSEHGRPDGSGSQGSLKVAVQYPSTGESSSTSPQSVGAAIKRGEPAPALTPSA